jgi:hypothetical protein
MATAGADWVRRGVTALVGVESSVEALLDRLRPVVAAHARTAAAFERFHAVAKEQRDALAAHVRELGGEGGGAAADTEGAVMAAGGDACTGDVSRALRDAYLAFNEAAVGYSVLHETAHVCDSTRFGATLRLAERHLKGYAGAAQLVNQLIPGVVAWELRRAGQDCDCRCPACALGICWCIAHSTDAIDTAWRETAPPHPSRGLRVAPNGRRPAELDVREGDVVIAVDGRRVATTADVTAAVVGRSPGEPVTLGIERPGVGAMEVVATRR